MGALGPGSAGLVRKLLSDGFVVFIINTAKDERDLEKTIGWKPVPENLIHIPSVLTYNTIFKLIIELDRISGDMS